MRAGSEVYCGYKEVSSLFKGMPGYEVARFTADIKSVSRAPKGRFSYAMIHDANGVAIAWDGAWVPPNVWFTPQMMKGLVRATRSAYIAPKAREEIRKHPERFGLELVLVERLLKAGFLIGSRKFLERLWMDFRDEHPIPYILSVYQPFGRDGQYCLEKVDEKDVTATFAAYVAD